MKSKLNITEFRKRLDKNTEKGNAYFMFNPIKILYSFDNYNKKFFGKIDDNSFEIAKLSIFYMAPFIIKGNYELLNDNETYINFEIKLAPYFLWVYGIIISIPAIFSLINKDYFGLILMPINVLIFILYIYYEKYSMKSSFINILKISKN